MTGYVDSGDDTHEWVRPPAPPCPDCGCCTARLCETARDRRVPCSTIGAPGPDGPNLNDCPCAARDALRRTLATVAQLDPSNPANTGMWTGDATENMYGHRRGALYAAALYARAAGIPATVTPDPAPAYPEYPAVLTIVLPTGQVTWHLPPLAYGWGFPADGPAWDGHDTAEKYRRVAAYVNGCESKPRSAEPNPIAKPDKESHQP